MSPPANIQDMNHIKPHTVYTFVWNKQSGLLYLRTVEIDLVSLGAQRVKSLSGLHWAICLTNQAVPGQATPGPAF